MLHSWYQGAALLVPGCCTFLVPFFQFVYRQYFQVPDLFIFRKIAEIRLREISVQLNIREFFSNTNRTNNTNLASAWHLLSLGQ